MSARFNVSFFYAQKVSYTERVPAGTPFDAVIEPKWWAHVAGNLLVNSTIEVTPEDLAWFAELYVVEVGDVWAKVAVLRKVALVVQQDSQDELEVEWSGPHTKFRVKRGQEVLKAGFADKADAKKWRDDYVKAA
jgi:hypothetical protein